MILLNHIIYLYIQYFLYGYLKCFIYYQIINFTFIYVYFYIDAYKLTGEVLGQGAYASVQTCVSVLTGLEFAVKVIDKIAEHARARVFREVETFYHCQGHPNIIQMLEFFEADDKFYMVFEKVVGGQLLDRIQQRKRFTEREASLIVKDLASALNFLHQKGKMFKCLLNSLICNANNLLLFRHSSSGFETRKYLMR